jgi:digalactosyldiacylglycerol synthase
VNSLVVQANCHRVVKLSGVLQEFAPMSECVENVHGIREAYLMEGERRRLSMATVTTGNTKQRRAYFIGKLLWAKGFDQLLELEATFRERTGEYLQMDIFGSGPDECEIKRAFTAGGISGGTEGSSRIFTRLNTWGGESSRTNNKRRSCLPVNFMGKSDHLSVAGDDYSIFINPSLTEVLCTTTAEAIAMGKWAIIPKHPSNAFFVQFPNCLSYRNRREFVSTVKYALINDPPPLSYQQAQLLSWEEATVRCIKSAAISKRDSARKARLTKAKEEKTLKKTLSGLLRGDPK